MGESSKQAIERSGHNTNLGEATMHASSVILSLVQEAATLAPFAELQRAAAVALIIFETIQAVKDNKVAYKRLGDDSTGLIVAIWRSFKKAESQKEWLSADMQEILVELTHILNHISSFVREKLARNKAMRLIHSRADVRKIADYRENLNAAMQKFELQSHMNIDLKLGKLSEQIRHRNGEDIKRFLETTAHEVRDLEEAERIHEQELKAVKKISMLEHLKQFEVDHQAEDEREHSTELKKREKGKDRQLELEQLRTARAVTVEMANRLKKAEEEEMVELRRKIAAGRRSTTMLKAQPRKNKRSSTQEDQVDDEEDWRKEEEEKRRMKTFNVKTNPRRSPRGPHGALETSTDDEEPLRRSKMRTARRKLSDTPPNFKETEDQPTGEEKSPPSKKKSPKVARKPQIPPGSPPGEADDLMAQFTPLRGSPHGSRSSSPMYYPPYGSFLPPSMTPGDGYGYNYGYGYGGGVPGTVVNTGVGNITYSTVSNVGNDNSVKKVYH